MRSLLVVTPVFNLFAQLVSAKTAGAKLESEVQQEKGTLQDLRKTLADERGVMSAMDMEHQQQLVELEQRHQEKVILTHLHRSSLTCSCVKSTCCLQPSLTAPLQKHCNVVSIHYL